MTDPALTPEMLAAIQEALDKATPCPKCGGDKYLVVYGSHAEHDPGCDGSCRNCPVEVPDEYPGPCDCVMSPASITEAEYQKMLGWLRALLDQVEAQEQVMAAHRNAAVQACAKHHLTLHMGPDADGDMVTAGLAALAAQVEAQEKALAASRQLFRDELKHTGELQMKVEAQERRTCDTCSESVQATSGHRYCIGPGHGVACEEFGNTCGAWRPRDGGPEGRQT